MTREAECELDILQAIAGCAGTRPVLEPGRLYEMVNEVRPDRYGTDELFGCLRRIAGEGLIHTPQELKPPLRGGGLSGTINTTLPQAGQTRLNELKAS